MLGFTSKHHDRQVKMRLGNASVNIAEMVMKALGKSFTSGPCI